MSKDKQVKQIPTVPRGVTDPLVRAFLEAVKERIDAIEGSVGPGFRRLTAEDLNPIDPGVSGLLTILGNIQVQNYHRHVSFSPGKTILGPTAPTFIVIGTGGVLRFNADGEVAYVTFEVPEDWVTDTNMTLDIHWVPESVIADGETVKWDISYRTKTDAEAIDGGSATALSVTYTQSGAGTANEHITSEIMLPYNDANNPLTVKDMVLIAFNRDMTGDTFAGDTALIQWDLHLVSNTMPKH